MEHTDTIISGMQKWARKMSNTETEANMKVIDWLIGWQTFIKDAELTPDQIDQLRDDMIAEYTEPDTSGA